MERFFLNLKIERVWQREYANQMEASKDVTDYIVAFYNCTRRHSALGNLAPLVYEKQFAAKRKDTHFKLRWLLRLRDDPFIRYPT